jgi:V8-like Glu-specific endopeptidase
VIQHPNGDAKQIAAGTLAGVDGDYLTYGDLDTLSGSSGAGILDSDGKVVGIHTNGGCTAMGGTNSGVRMARIVTTTP